MSNVDIKIFPIARTSVDRVEVRKWLNHLGAVNYEMPDTSVASDPALLIALKSEPLLFGDFSFDADGSLVPKYRKV